MAVAFELPMRRAIAQACRTVLGLPLAGALSVLLSATSVAGQPPAPPTPQATAAQADAEAAIAAAAVQASVAGTPATLTFANRPIVTLRASILGRPAEERVAVGRALLDRLVEEGVYGPVTMREVEGAASLDLAGQRIVAILPVDVDALAGETVGSTAAAAVTQLQHALDEVSELDRPWQLLGAIAQVLVVTVVFVGIIWSIWKTRIKLGERIGKAAHTKLQATQFGTDEFVRSSRIIELLKRVVGFVSWGVSLFVLYSWLTFTLRRFPYTRPWGESLRTFLVLELSAAAVAILQALPGLFTVLLIVLGTRFVARIVLLFFQSLEAGRISVPWIYPETAQPTRKLVTVGLWLFAAVLAYPHLPGSDSEAFKGMSVFVGLVVSLGSSGIVNQMMSGLTLTYSRALRLGDYVKVGDIEGRVTEMGSLSTKIKTIKGEDVTTPNALMVSQTVINYSRLADTEGVFVPTEVTIGYDAPWRQVEALLLLAASRTAGIRQQPRPIVVQAALEDAYIRYALLFCLEDPAQRRPVLSRVHREILDAFNEYGVQITSPNYEADPERKKVVPRDQWFAAPAMPPRAGVAVEPALVPTAVPSNGD
jgi:small-conductance mechanosensitive channel